MLTKLSSLKTEFTGVDFSKYTSKVSDFVDRFSNYSGSLASSITDKTVRDRIMKIFTEECVSYCSTSFPTDFYVDLASLFSGLSPFASGTASIRSALRETMYRSWSASGGECSLGLFFCVYRSTSVIQSSHPALYVNGSRDPLLSRFVRDCTGYVPGSGEKRSLLDRLFYTTY